MCIRDRPEAAFSKITETLPETELKLTVFFAAGMAADSDAVHPAGRAPVGRRLGTTARPVLYHGAPCSVP
eukprot:2670456-Rhodomonas_salina.2